MPTPLKVLLVEDCETDAELIRRNLQKADFDLQILRVETADELAAGLNQKWDVVISDYQLPNFNGHAALALVRRLSPDTPLIVVSGTISEETALTLMREGAADYLMKDRLARLGVLVRRELNIAQVIQERKEARTALANQDQALADLHKMANVFQYAGWGIVVASPDGKTIELTNPAFARMHGYNSVSELVGRPVIDVFPKQYHNQLVEVVRSSQERGQLVWEGEHLRKDGSTFPVLMDVTTVKDAAGTVQYRIVYVQDITERKRMESALEKRMVALTRPVDPADPVSFEDLFNLDEIQTLQDEFAAATGVASIITHPDGRPITRPSNFCHLCNGIIRKTAKGLENCFRSDAELGKLSTSGPTIAPCMSGGLWDAGAGISVSGKPIANWLIGQVRDETQTEEQMRRYAREIDADENEIIGAFSEVPAMSHVQFEQVAKMLFTFANQLSKLAYQNVQQARLITEQHQVEDLLKEGEEKFRSITENAFDMIALLDIDGRILYCNKTHTLVLGFHPAELLGINGIDLLHPDDRDHLHGIFLSMLAGKTGIIQNLVVRARCKDGRYKWIEQNYRQIHAGQDKPVQILLNAQDISERKRTEEALRITEEKFATAFRISPDSININRLRDGLYLEINEGFTSLTGYTAEDVIGKTSSEIHIWVNPEDRVRLVKGLKENGVVTNLEAPFRMKDGSIKISLMSARILNFNGEMCILSITRDISDRKQAEEQIRQMNITLEQRVKDRTTQLEVANRELEAFSYSVSHDLRAPLRTLDGFSELLLEEYGERLDENGRDYLDHIQEASQRMGRLISDLLNLSRITRVELVRQKVDLSAQADEIAENLLKQTPQRSINFTIEDGLVVDGDPDLLRIVLENMFSNAVKFTSNQPAAYIQLGVIDQEGERVFYLRDNGAGFDMEYAGRLFSPFQRLHRAVDFPGTGIGLVIVQRIITRHGGRIWPDAQVDMGATFYFTIPSTHE